MADAKWWNACNPVMQTEISLPDRMIEARLMVLARASEGFDKAIESSGYGDPVPILDAILIMPSMRLIIEERKLVNAAHYHFAWNNGYVVVHSFKEGNLRVNAMGDPDTCEKIAALCEVHVKPSPTEKGTVFAVVRTQNGLGLHQVGAVHAPFHRTNYSEDVIQDYQHVVSCLSSADPCGRLVLLEGPPGTGKSYIIRALAGEIEATFVLVGSSLVGEISGPEVLPVLLQAKGQAGTEERRPVVLILEDADAALVQRDRGDLCRISDVLNLGDGLLGELVDVRVIATSNADHMDLDPAIARAGRMCRHVRVQALGRESATALHRSMVKTTSTLFNSETTLADVYRAARCDGWEPPSRDSEFRPGDYR